jgi:hypothetical protein
MPTGNNIPLFVKDDFDKFYSSVFTNQWRKEGKNIGLLEYAWDVSPVNYMKCDPCVGNPPDLNDMIQAGVWWLNNRDVYDDNGSRTYFTRTHFRYNRNSFAQDLVFQVTPNTENYQARYVVTHPATGSFDCDAGKAYLNQLKSKRRKELRELVTLTGSTLNDYLSSTGFEDLDESPAPAASYAALAPTVSKDMKDSENGSGALALFSLAMISGAAVLRWKGLI